MGKYQISQYNVVETTRLQLSLIASQSPTTSPVANQSDLNNAAQSPGGLLPSTHTTYSNVKNQSQRLKRYIY